MTRNYDVAVIGNGVYGLMTALKLTHAGQRVVLLDRNLPYHPDAASSGLTRAAHRLYDDPTYFDLAARSLDHYRNAYPGVITPNGAVLLSLGETKPSHASQVLHALPGQFKAMDKAAITQAYPALRADEGCYDAEGGVFRVREIQAQLHEQIRQSTVTTFYDYDVARIEKPGHYRLTNTTGDIINAGKIVLCAGSFSQDILRTFEGLETFDLGLRIVTLETLMHFRPTTPTQRNAMSALPAFAYIERGLFGLPVIDGYSPEVKIATFFKPGSNETQGMDVMDFMKTCIPALIDMDIVEPSIQDHCSYDYTKDGHFIVGPLPGYPDAVIACGWNGGGYKFAPAITDLIADYLLTGKNALPEIFRTERL